MTRAAIMPQWMQDRLSGTAERPGEITLSPDEALSFSLFVALGTQWDRHAMTGARLGLRYDVIRPTAENMGLDFSPAMFADIQLMETAALAEFARAAR